MTVSCKCHHLIMYPPLSSLHFKNISGLSISSQSHGTNVWGSWYRVMGSLGMAPRIKWKYSRRPPWMGFTHTSHASLGCERRVFAPKKHMWWFAQRKSARKKIMVQTPWAYILDLTTCASVHPMPSCCIGIVVCLTFHWQCYVVYKPTWQGPLVSGLCWYGILVLGNGKLLRDRRPDRKL